MTEITLLVGLKIPDTTAITTFHTLKEELDYSEIKTLKRLVYYNFLLEENIDINQFKEKIVKTDILVNSNKNTSEVIEGEFSKENSVLVKSIENECQGMIETLSKLGVKGIKEMEKGILWTFDIENQEKIKETIKKATEELLYNKHYQAVVYY